MFQKKKNPKTGGAQTLSSGNPASEPSEMTPVPEAAFVMMKRFKVWLMDMTVGG